MNIIDSIKWICDRCSYYKDKYLDHNECLICPIKGKGVMKCNSKGQTVHPVIYIYIIKLNINYYIVMLF